MHEMYEPKIGPQDGDNFSKSCRQIKPKQGFSYQLKEYKVRNVEMMKPFKIEGVNIYVKEKRISCNELIYVTHLTTRKNQHFYY